MGKRGAKGTSNGRFYLRICAVVSRLEAAAEERPLTQGEKRQLKIARKNKERIERQKKTGPKARPRRAASPYDPKDLYGGVRSVVSGGLPGQGKR